MKSKTYSYPSRRVLQGLTDNCPTQLAYLDPEFNFVFANPAYINGCGHTWEDLRGRNHFHFFPNAENEAIFRRVRTTGQAVSFYDKPFAYPDQPERGLTYWDWTLTPVADLGGHIEGLVLSLMETTARKTAQEATKRVQSELDAQVQARQNHERLKSVFEGISDPLILLDEHRKVQMANTAAIAYYRMTTFEDIMGSTLCTKDVSDSRCRQCPIPDAVAARQHINFERRGYMDSATTEAITVFPIAVPKDDKKVSLIRICDITEAKHIERNLIRTEKLASIGVLAAGLAHEVNNPNNFIMFNVPVLRRYLDAILPVLKQHVENRPDTTFCNLPLDTFATNLYALTDAFENGSTRIKNIVSKLRDYSAPNDSVILEWGSPREVILHAVEIARPQIQGRIRHFGVVIPENLPEIRFEPQGLEQILVNLLINAAQAADKEDSRIQLQVAVSHGRSKQLVIEVCDNGCGIAENDLPRLFDPFFTTKPPGQGTGLGLYVSQNLILGMHGEIDVHSRPGEGATFRITLACR